MASAPTAGATIIEVLRARVELEPERTAIAVVGGRSLTFADWWRRAEQVAHAVRSLAPHRRTVVLRFSGASFDEFAVAYVGVLRAGSVAVLPPIGTTEAVLEDLVRACDPVLVVAADHLARPAEVGVTELLRRGEGPGSLLPDLDPDAPADIQFTSGTTGRPRAVLTRHETLCAAYASTPLDSQPSTDDVVLTALPFGTTFAHTVFLDSIQYPRSSLVVAPSFDPETFLATCRDHEATITFLVPTMANLLVARARPHGTTVRSLALVCVAGSASKVEQLRGVSALFPSATIVNSYCSTESWPAGTDRVFTGDGAGVGRPWEGRQVRVVDAAGATAPPGVAGAIHLRTLGLLPRERAFWDPGDDGPFLADGWIATGDRGTIDVDGELTVLGRGIDVADVGGLVVDLAFVDLAMAGCPGVVDAAAVALPHPVLGQFVAAVVQADETFDQAAFYERLLADVGVEAMPRVVALGAVARNPDGSPRRAHLATETSWDGSSQGEELSPDEAWLARRWTDLLGPLPLGPDANFFAVGGQSLDVAELVAHLIERHDIEIGLDEVFTHPTLGALARLVSERRRSRPVPAVPAPTQEEPACESAAVDRPS